MDGIYFIMLGENQEKYMFPQRKHRHLSYKNNLFFLGRKKDRKRKNLRKWFDIKKII